MTPLPPHWVKRGRDLVLRSLFTTVSGCAVATRSSVSAWAHGCPAHPRVCLPWGSKALGVVFS